jgi:hypothetical protein
MLTLNKKGTSKPFLRSSWFSPLTLYAFAILEIQTESSLYAAPLTQGAGLLSALSAHHITNLCLLGRLSCCPPLRLLHQLKGLGCYPPHLLIQDLEAAS